MGNYILVGTTSWFIVDTFRDCFKTHAVTKEKKKKWFQFSFGGGGESPQFSHF